MLINLTMEQSERCAKACKIDLRVFQFIANVVDQFGNYQVRYSDGTMSWAKFINEDECRKVDEEIRSVKSHNSKIFSRKKELPDMPVREFSPPLSQYFWFPRLWEKLEAKCNVFSIHAIGGDYDIEVGEMRYYDKTIRDDKSDENPCLALCEAIEALEQK